MLTLNYTYKLKPTIKQIADIEHNLNVCKSVWNYALAQRKLWYNSRSCDINKCSIKSEYIVEPFEYPDYHKQSAELTEAKKTNNFLKSGNAQALQQTLRKLDRAFNDMKAKGCGFPRFKKKLKSFVLIPTKNKCQLKGNKLVGVPMLKTLKVINSRDIPEGFIIKQIQIIKKASGYYINLAIELNVDLPTPIPHGHALGIDVGIQSMLVTSDGLTIPRPKFLDKKLRKIKLLQRKLRNKKLGSNKWKKLNNRIALLHEAVANKRKDYHFKLSHSLTKDIGMVFVEDINFVSWSKGMFSKQSLDMGIGQFITILKYVCFRTDTYFEKVDKNHTSQICSNCGTHTGKKELNERIHSCPECGYENDRDIVAAEVIRNRGLETLNTAVGAPVVKQPSDGVLAGAIA